MQKKFVKRECDKKIKKEAYRFKKKSLKEQQWDRYARAISYITECEERAIDLMAYSTERIQEERRRKLESSLLISDNEGPLPGIRREAYAFDICPGYLPTHSANTALQALPSPI